MTTFTVIGCVAGFIGVLDARTRAKVETEFNLNLWQQYIGSQFSRLQSEHEVGTVVTSLRNELVRARHVTATLVPRNGLPIPLHTTVQTAKPAQDEGAETPAWFTAFVRPVTEVRTVALSHGSQSVATVYLSAKPDDEIAESWVLLSQLAFWWLAGLLVTAAGLYVILGFVLDPLLTFANGIQELEDGHYDFRLAPTNIRELSAVSTNFNTLAGALGRARADNSRLYRELIAVQEEERRQIAADLHDEVGPCIFGIMANMRSISTQAQSMTGPHAASILAAAGEIGGITDKLKTMNRAILARLRPLALGKVSLADLLSDLITSFARANPAVRFDRSMQGIEHSFGEQIDLTLFRCVQEGITNALKHGKASAIEIVLQKEEMAGAIELNILDNGLGYAASSSYGFGLSMMNERVRLLNGSMQIGAGLEGGTLLTISIPDTSNRAEITQ